MIKCILSPGCTPLGLVYHQNHFSKLFELSVFDESFCQLTLVLVDENAQV